MAGLRDWGTWFAEIIFAASNLLREDHVPGWVAAALILFLVGLATLFFVQVWMRRRALYWLKDVLKQADSVADFSSRIDQITAQVVEERRGKRRRSVSDAWSEYKETLVAHEEDGHTTQRNAVRPNLFFNIDDLHFGFGNWRILPGLFVTVGLFLTFLGLISALQSMQAETGITDEAMANLLAVASAKFIMSLAGLLCSILFTIILRVGIALVEKAIHTLNTVLEHRLSFISAEDLAVEQLAATREQREHFRAIGMELVAELARPLREDLPRSISESIGTAIEPVMEKVTQMGTAGVGEMVQDLSSRFAQDVDGVLGRASERLAEAADRIGHLVDRMDDNAGEMRGAMQDVVTRLGAAVEELRTTMASGANAAASAFGEGVESLLSAMNATLTGIRDNTREGANALRDAATEMRTAAASIRSELEAAAQESAAAARTRLQSTGEQVNEAISDAAHEIFSTTEEAAKRAREELLTPLQSFAEQLDSMVNTLTNGVDQFRRLADGVRTGADATSEASGSFRSAAQALIEATAPIHDTVVQMRGSADRLADSTRHVAQNTQATVDGAHVTLDAAKEALGGERQAMQATLQGLDRLVRELDRQSDRIGELDTKLSDAFGTYAAQVQAAVDGLFGHVREMRRELDPAVDTMREVVEQAQQFVPESKRR